MALDQRGFRLPQSKEPTTGSPLSTATVKAENFTDARVLLGPT
jgi:hypothetical protein